MEVFPVFATRIRQTINRHVLQGVGLTCMGFYIKKYTIGKIIVLQTLRIKSLHKIET